MNIWTAFFLVVSIVVLATPILLSRDYRRQSGPDPVDGNDIKPVLEDDELELDLALGRLAREDYDIMSARKSEPGSGMDASDKGDHGNLPEG